jgi:outer membrane phospholipase A
MSSQVQAASDEYITPKTWLEGYKPNYFLYGTPDSKIQLSAKVQILEEARLYFGYSQLMFWNISYASSPIADVNFNPELFFRFDFSGPAKEKREVAPDDSPEGPKTWLDLGIFEHESNGESFYNSRAWNRSYVRYVLEGRYENNVRIYSSFKAWVPYVGTFDQMNPDLLYYRGLYEVEFTCANFLGEAFTRSDLTLRVYSGGPSHLDPFAGGQELTLRFTRRMHPQIVPLWTLQVFNGYGEDLLYYNQRRTVFRGGLSF